MTGGGEHGPHAIIPGPDGRLYLCAGNQTDLPEKIDRSRVPRHWSEDHMLGRMPDGRGFMANRLAPGGFILSFKPDGSDVELVSTGFRNQYDIAFNPLGDLFTYDADMEWDIGTPWYRPTRVNHVISGAEFGWRNGTGKWPEYFADSFGAVANIGYGSPTGITFGTGAKFPAKFQNALFISDWSYGVVYALGTRRSFLQKHLRVFRQRFAHASDRSADPSRARMHVHDHRGSKDPVGAVSNPLHRQRKHPTCGVS
jgi:glucose/arabinose dehydrogenase